MSNYLESELDEATVQGQPVSEPKKKIFFLPSIYQGPVLLYFQKYYLNNAEVQIKPLKSSSRLVLERQASHLSERSAMPRQLDQALDSGIG